MKKIAILLAVALTLSACRKEPVEKEEPVKEEVLPDNSRGLITKSKHDLVLGDRVSIDDLSVSIAGVTKAHKIGDFVPKSNQFSVFAFSVLNEGSADASLAPLKMMVLEDEAGNTYSPQYINALPTEKFISTGELETVSSGMTVYYEMAFDAPYSDLYTLKVNEVRGKEEFSWDFQLKE